MKKIFTFMVAAATLAGAYAELPKALYVKSGDSYSKYNFGVAGDMKFSDNGNKLQITGYENTIDLNKVDWISFNAPLDMGLTPSEQKQKMIDIGEEVNKRVNLNDYAELVRMIDRYFNVCCMELPEEWEDMYDDGEDDDYYAPAYVASLADALKSVKKIAKGNVAAARVLKKDELYIYRLADFNGIYRIYNEDNDGITWDRDEGADLYWKKIGDAENFELRYSATDGGTYYVIVDHADNYVQWEEKDGIVQIPASINLTLKKDSQVLATSEIKLGADNVAKTLDINLSFMANDLNVKSNMHINNYRITDEVTVDQKGERLVTTTARVNGVNLTDYDSLKADIESMDGYEDEDWNWVYGDDGEALLGHFRNASADADVLGLLQIHGKVAKLNTWFEGLESDDDEDYVYDPFADKYDADKNCFNYYYGNRSEVEKQADFLGRYSDLYFTYDGKPEMQGYLTYGCYEDVYSYETEGYWKYMKLDGRPANFSEGQDWGYVVIDGEEVFVYYNDYYDAWMYETYTSFDIPATVFEYDYELRPYLTFPDGTSYEFDENEFFNESSFGLLIDDYDVIIDTYESIVGSK